MNINKDDFGFEDVEAGGLLALALGIAAKNHISNSFDLGRLAKSRQRSTKIIKTLNNVGRGLLAGDLVDMSRRLSKTGSDSSKNHRAIGSAEIGLGLAAAISGSQEPHGDRMKKNIEKYYGKLGKPSAYRNYHLSVMPLVERMVLKNHPPTKYTEPLHIAQSINSFITNKVIGNQKARELEYVVREMLRGKARSNALLTASAALAGVGAHHIVESHRKSAANESFDPEGTLITSKVPPNEYYKITPITETLRVANLRKHADDSSSGGFGSSFMGSALGTGAALAGGTMLAKNYIKSKARSAGKLGLGAAALAAIPLAMKAFKSPAVRGATEGAVSTVAPLAGKATQRAAAYLRTQGAARNVTSGMFRQGTKLRGLGFNPGPAVSSGAEQLGFKFGSAYPMSSVVGTLVPLKPPQTKGGQVSTQSPLEQAHTAADPVSGPQSGAKFAGLAPLLRHMHIDKHTAKKIDKAVSSASKKGVKTLSQAERIISRHGASMNKELQAHIAQLIKKHLH